MKRIFLLILLVPVRLSAYVYAYAQLYSKATDTTIDILYDIHRPKKNLTLEIMNYDPFWRIKPKLYATEQKIDDALSFLNKQRRSVACVWESIAKVPDSFAPLYMPFGDRFVGQRYPYLTFINADTWRFQEKGISEILFDYDAFEKRVNKRAIQRNYGRQIWDSYLYVVEEMYKYTAFDYKPYRDEMKNKTLDEHHPDNSLVFARFADFEMLNHILSSSDKHIILYAGGGHASFIQAFLMCFAGFSQELCYTTYNGDELDPALLAPLTGEAIPFSVRARHFFNKHAESLKVAASIGLLGLGVGITEWSFTGKSFKKTLFKRLVKTYGYYAAFTLMHRVGSALFSKTYYPVVLPSGTATS